MDWTRQTKDPMFARRAAAVTLLAAVLLITGCGEDETGTPDNDLNVGEPDTYAVGGELRVDDDDLLAADDIVVRNGDDELTLDETGEFTFSQRLEDGDEYDVDIEQSLAEHDCDVIDGTGVVDGADVDDITVDCTLIDVPPETPFFGVNIDAEESTLDVEEGQTVIIDVIIENEETIADEQDIHIDIGGVYEETKEDVHIDAQSTAELTFEWTTNIGDAGSYGATVSSRDDSDEVTVTVDDADIDGDVDLAITIDEAESELEAEPGDPIDVAVTALNNTDDAISQQLTLDIDDIQQDAVDVDVDANSPQSVSLQWQTDSDDSGWYEVVVAGDDDSDSALAYVGDADGATLLAGSVDDTENGDGLEGVDIMAFESGSDSLVDSAITDADGDYEFTDLDSGTYDLRLEAPGLDPNYEIDGTGGDDTLEVTVADGLNTQNLSIDWMRQTDFIVDGGYLDFEFGASGGILEFELPECEEQSDGSFEAGDVDVGNDDIDVAFDPDGDCFRIDDVGIDIATGQLDVDTGDISFPDVEITVDDQDNDINDLVDEVDVEFEWIFDGIAGDVDFITGDLDIDIDLRLLLGGTAQTILLPVDFGSRAGDNDCQFTGAWGGDVTSPQSDTNDDQVGEYLHDPIEMQLTTGESGPNDVEGVPYDADEQLFLTVDNDFEIGRLSEGPDNADDPGGAACADDIEDFAAVLNDLIDLPADSGSLLGEFDFWLP